MTNENSRQTKSDAESDDFRAYASIGSNISPKDNIKKLIVSLVDISGIQLLKLSSVYETKPVGMSHDVDNFHNLCIEIETDKPPESLKGTFQELETELGRNRTDNDEVRPRVIDLDILLYDPMPENFESHRQIEDEAFVVYPLQEILDPSDFDFLPASAEEWKSHCDSGVIIRTVSYQWPEAVTAHLR